MVTERDIVSVLSAYGIRPESTSQIDRVVGGWSGSLIWKVAERGGHDFCLRLWPQQHPREERLLYIHGVLGEVGKSLPIVACPLPALSGGTFVRDAEHFWELTPWMPGQADFHRAPSDVRLRAAMQALARFHNAAGSVQTTRGAAAAWTDRQQQVQELRCGGMDQIAVALAQSSDPEFDVTARQLWPLARKGFDRIVAHPLISAKTELHLLPAIRDIHREHVLFTDDEVTGLIDFGALRLDTPLADIARLIGSLVGDDRERRRIALDAYTDLRPLSTEDRGLIDFFDESGQVLAAFNWLCWLYVEGRDMGPPEPITRRLEEIASRLRLL